MPFHNICSKTDRALAAYLVSVGAGTVDNVWPAKRSLDKTLPCTVCWSHTATEDPPYSGTFVVEAYVEVRTSGIIESGETPDEPRLDSDSRVMAAFDAFHTDLDSSSAEALATDITNAGRALGDADMATFTCQQITVKEVTAGFNPRVTTQQGNAWVDCIHMELVCTPGDTL